MHGRIRRIDRAERKRAIRLLNAKTFDVVLTDVLMPDTDGLELLTHIRSMAVRPAVIAMSGGGTHVTTYQGLSLAVKLGAQAPLVKPFTREELLTAIASVLKR